MKKKLKLNDLKVKSFVTQLNTTDVMGGNLTPDISKLNCPSDGVLNPCLTGNYRTLPVENCVQNTLDLVYCVAVTNGC